MPSDRPTVSEARAPRKIQVVGSVAFIPLTKGRAAMIDAKDVHLVEGFSWHLRRSRRRKCSYAVCSPYGGRQIRLHRALMGLEPGDGKQVDHVNRNGLDCRRENMRLCSHAQNQHNRQPQLNGSSDFKGVSWRRRDKRWEAQIKVNGKKRHLGTFTSEVEAAHAYDAVAADAFGEFAYLNFPEAGQ